MLPALSPAHQTLVMVEWHGDREFEACPECDGCRSKHDAGCALDAELASAGLDTQEKREAARASVLRFREQQAAARRAKEIAEAKVKWEAEPTPGRPADVHRYGVSIRCAPDGAWTLWARLHESSADAEGARRLREQLIAAGVPAGIVDVVEWWEPGDELAALRAQLVETEALAKSLQRRIKAASNELADP